MPERRLVRDITAAKDNERIAVGTKRGSVTAERRGSFGCVVLLSTCTKAKGPWELMLPDTRRLILWLRPPWSLDFLSVMDLTNEMTGNEVDELKPCNVCNCNSHAKKSIIH